jgi:hypothetical protein
LNRLSANDYVGWRVTVSGRSGQNRRLAGAELFRAGQLLAFIVVIVAFGLLVVAGTHG